MKIIKIDNCNNCPHSQPVPWSKSKEYRYFCSELNKSILVILGEIHKECPLEDIDICVS